MATFNSAVMYFLSFKSYVVLPVIIFILAMVFRIKITTAIKSALTIGIGFIGIFMTFDYFIKIINPVVQALIKRSGLHLNVLDGGWPPLAAIAWSFKLAPLLIVLFMLINIVMLVLKKTRTVDIDIWNYWHVILGSSMVYSVTGNVVLAILAAMISFFIVLKLAEWTAPMANKFSGMKGICFPHLEGITYFPLALLANKIMDKIPGFNKLDTNPEKIQQKLGLLGEPMILGFIMGMALGIGGGYDIKSVSDLAVGFAAVIYILPKMCEILGSSLIPISEGMKVFINKHFPDLGETYIGLDIVVVFGNASVVVTALLLIPVALILAFVLPGINFIPLGDLTSLMVPIGFICIATNGNVIRSFIIGVPMMIGNLYIASIMAGFFTKMAVTSNYQISGYNGKFTSFLSGGNFYRFWLIKAFSGEFLALILIPVVIGLLIFTWKATTGPKA